MTSELVFDSLVHYQHNYQKTYFFVEIDVYYRSDPVKIYRSSHHVRSTDMDPKKICFIKEWNYLLDSNTGKTKEPEDIEINLLTPIRNQKTWLEFMIKMLEELFAKTNEKNVSIFLSKNDNFNP